MPFYTYQGCDSAGAAETGVIEASNEKLAFDTLQSRGLTVFELQAGSTAGETNLPWYRRDISFSGGRLPLEEQAATAQLLSVLFGAGLSASEVIRITSLSSEKIDVRKHFERLGQRVEDGANFAEAFELENRRYSPIFVSFLKVSVEANTLPELLSALGRFLQKQSDIKQKIISAFIYPFVLCVAAVILLLVIILYLAPNLEPLFLSVEREPPGTLAFLLAMNEFLRSYWPALLVMTGIVITSVVASLQVVWVRAITTRFLLRLPVLGQVLRLSALSRLTQSTQLLLLSGQSIVGALRISAHASGGAHGFEVLFEEAAEAIEAGTAASSVFADVKEVPSNFKELFRIGEETNRLPGTLETLAEALSVQADRQSARLLQLLTPTLTLVVGLGIGFLVYTLMSAILEVNELAF